MDFWTREKNKSAERFQSLSQEEKDYLECLSEYIEAFRNVSATSDDKMELGCNLMEAKRKLK